MALQQRKAGRHREIWRWNVAVAFSRWWQRHGSMLFSFSWRMQTFVINHRWLTNYITLPFITRVGPLSVDTMDNLYALIFLEAFSSTHRGVQSQAANRILHHRPPLKHYCFFISFLSFFFFSNKSNWFPTGWIISLLTCILLWPIKVTPALRHRADLGNACKSYISSPAHSK